ncbi:hypothetical protein Sjap_022129 [Stephania japonica]|uniref:Uncharacterized protein n=1 Tax=Stephania japonica TaxID=461633 RepID=A0AAP0ETN1_9MAGN
MRLYCNHEQEAASISDEEIVDRDANIDDEEMVDVDANIVDEEMVDANIDDEEMVDVDANIVDEEMVDANYNGYHELEPLLLEDFCRFLINRVLFDLTT